MKLLLAITIIAAGLLAPNNSYASDLTANRNVRFTGSYDPRAHSENIAWCEQANNGRGGWVKTKATLDENLFSGRKTTK